MLRVKITLCTEKKLTLRLLKKAISDKNKGKAGFAGADNPSAKKVLCVETSETYTTIKAASEAVGCSLQNISMCLRGVTKTAKGYTWVYL